MPKDQFELVSKYQPSGDQPDAIKKLIKGIEAGEKEQTLLGATGTGKTFTVSNVIKEVNKPTLVIAQTQMQNLIKLFHNSLSTTIPMQEIQNTHFITPTSLK